MTKGKFIIVTWDKHMPVTHGDWSSLGVQLVFGKASPCYFILGLTQHLKPQNDIAFCVMLKSVSFNSF